MSRAISLRYGPVCFDSTRRSLVTQLGLLACILGLATYALFMGDYPVSTDILLQVLRGEASTLDNMIVMHHRLPRILTAITTGMAFGLAGEMTQTLLRNPLASPEILGFGSGATMGAVWALSLGGSGAIVLGAMGGGALAVLLVFILSWEPYGRLQLQRLVLVGIGVSLTLGTVAALLMTRLNVVIAAELTQWLIGTLNNRSWEHVQLAWTGLAALLPLALWAQFPLTRLYLGDDKATSLGINLPFSRLAVLAIVVALIGLAIATAGPLPFVAFVAGPIARALSDTRPNVFCAGLMGALITLAADCMARSLSGFAHLPAGVFTAMLGAPVLMWVLVVHYRKNSQ